MPNGTCGGVRGGAGDDPTYSMWAQDYSNAGIQGSEKRE